MPPPSSLWEDATAAAEEAPAVWLGDLEFGQTIGRCFAAVLALAMRAVVFLRRPGAPLKSA